MQILKKQNFRFHFNSSYYIFPSIRFLPSFHFHFHFLSTYFFVSDFNEHANIYFKLYFYNQKNASRKKSKIAKLKIRRSRKWKVKTKKKKNIFRILFKQKFLFYFLNVFIFRCSSLFFKKYKKQEEMKIYLHLENPAQWLHIATISRK
jgi:hypothetical protein